MKRGIVMNVYEQYAVVMTADGAFLRAPVHGKPQIGEEIVFEEEYRETAERRRTIKSVYRYPGAAAIVLLLLLPMLLVMFRDAHPVVAYVSMDINPSIEIGVDSDNRVRELHALNKDGESIVKGLSYKGIAVEQVAASLLERAKESHYLDVADKDIVITSMLVDGGGDAGNDYEAMLSVKIRETLIARLTELAAESITANITALSIPAELRDEAAANGVSSGKMVVYLMAKDEGYDIKLEELKQQSIDKATASIGGVKKIVADAPDTSKSKLKELVEREKEEKSKKAKETSKASATPKPTAAGQSGGNTKPAASGNKQDANKDGGRKPADSKNGNGKPAVTDKSHSNNSADRDNGRGSQYDGSGKDKSDDDKDDKEDDSSSGSDRTNDRDRDRDPNNNDNDDRDEEDDDREDNRDDDGNDDSKNDRDDDDNRNGGNDGRGQGSDARGGSRSGQDRDKR